MLGRNRAFTALSLCLLAACTLDSTNPTGSGAPGTGGMSASSSSNGATQPTTGAMTTASTSSGQGGTSSASGGPTTSSTNASSSADASSSSADASSSVSSSSGGVTKVPFCGQVTDDFNVYGSDGGPTGFIAVGEIAGPWAEDPSATNAVRWVAPGEIQTQFQMGTDAYLYTKTPIMIGGGTCATTVRLVDASDGFAVLGVSDGKNPTVAYAAVICKENNGSCMPLEPFGYTGNTVQIGSGIHLGIVFKNKHVFGYVDTGSGWQLLGGAPAQGHDVTTLADGPAYIYFGQQTGNATSHWDEFNVAPIPSDLVP